MHQFLENHILYSMTELLSYTYVSTMLIIHILKIIVKIRRIFIENIYELFIPYKKNLFYFICILFSVKEKLCDEIIR